MELEVFMNTSQTPPFAILSHTWGNGEVTFQDITQSWAKDMGGYSKIRGCCRQAVLDGYDYVWVDTCCIDKSSSAELSEAINSMYLWYTNAGLCYAFLADVGNDILEDDGGDSTSQFAHSLWWSRGWTLQELLAPAKVIFYSREWFELGSKATLQKTISAVTGIERQVLLKNNQEYVSIATRMSWAAKRKTTRIEDVAYCLMGIFGINMPVLYGEGEAAFIRLQEEIIRVSDDATIFAWRSSSQSDILTSGLLARSPQDFLDSAAYRPYVYRQNLPHNLTSRGLHVQVFLQKGYIDDSFMAMLNCCLADGRGPLQIFLSKTNNQVTRIKCDQLCLGDGSVNGCSTRDVFIRHRMLPDFFDPKPGKMLSD